MMLQCYTNLRSVIVLIDTWWNVNITFDDDGNITDMF